MIVSRNILIYCLVVLTLSFSCKKERSASPMPHTPLMRYTTYTDKALTKPFTAFHLDLDQDGKNDINIKTEPISDGSTYYSVQYGVSVGLNAYLLTSESRQTPAFNNDDEFSVEDRPNYNWYNLASNILSEQVTPLNGSIYWQGNWPNSAHRYVAIKILRDGKYYLGWIELSINQQTGAFSLHKTAMSTEALAAVKAGR